MIKALQKQHWSGLPRRIEAIAMPVSWSTKEKRTENLKNQLPTLQQGEQYSHTALATIQDSNFCLNCVEIILIAPSFAVSAWGCTALKAGGQGHVNIAADISWLRNLSL